MNHHLYRCRMCGKEFRVYSRLMSHEDLYQVRRDTARAHPLETVGHACCDGRMGMGEYLGSMDEAQDD